jgi:hypothetical protein
VNRYHLLLSGLLVLGACSKAGEIKKVSNRAKDPIEVVRPFQTFSADDQVSFTELPLRGDVRDQKHFWSDDYWPLNKGNINRRWNATVRIGFNHRSPTLDELRLMPQEKIAELAPSEKYDLLMGAYDYPLRKEVNQIAANLQAELWEGMVNGWAVASLRHMEPQPKTLTNPDGIQIPFGSEDIKGLLSYYYSYHQAPQAVTMIGKPCVQRGCVEDVTAASFHLALANMVGVKKKAFLMDLDRTRDVWNHPVVAYEAEYRGNAEIHDKVTPGTYAVIRIKTTVTYIDEALNMTWAPVLGTDNQLETKQVYSYWLHIDRDANIIGGEWKSNERPDYLWTIDETTHQFDGLLSGMTSLIDDPAPVIVTTEETTTNTETTTTTETGTETEIGPEEVGPEETGPEPRTAETHVDPVIIE